MISLGASWSNKKKGMGSGLQSGRYPSSIFYITQEKHLLEQSVSLLLTYGIIDTYPQSSIPSLGRCPFLCCLGGLHIRNYQVNKNKANPFFKIKPILKIKWNICDFLKRKYIYYANKTSNIIVQIYFVFKRTVTDVNRRNWVWGIWELSVLSL